MEKGGNKPNAREEKESWIRDSGNEYCAHGILAAVTSINDSPVAGGRRLDLWYRPTGQDLLL